jgi:hypothetical protein
MTGRRRGKREAPARVPTGAGGQRKGIAGRTWGLSVLFSSYTYTSTAYALAVGTYRRKTSVNEASVWAQRAHLQRQTDGRDKAFAR